MINQLAERSDPTELGGKLCHALADRLRITRGEASRRVAEAADLDRLECDGVDSASRDRVRCRGA
ncbi:MAG TPA: DUF222 domain-containing protein [Mycobacterium sp.]